MGIGRGGQEGLGPPRKIFEKSLGPRTWKKSFPRPCVPCFKSVANMALGLFGISQSLRFRTVMNGYLLAMYSANTAVK